MIKYVLPAAVAVLALGAPAAVQAQSAAPPPMAQPAPGMTNASADATGQPMAPSASQMPNGQPAAQPMSQGGQAMPGQAMAPNPYMQPGFTQRTVWIPGSYNWDPVRQTYVWSDGQYTEAPRENAQWVPGHWAQTPTAWIWMDGTWN